MTNIVTTWDGEEFDQKPEDEAVALEKAGKVQILRDGFIDGLGLKYRHEFDGYKTRELKAAAPKATPKAAPKKPQKTAIPKPTPKATPKAAAKAAPKPTAKKKSNQKPKSAKG
jgi:outer membrane biosynthesis protein TonB